VEKDNSKGPKPTVRMFVGEFGTVLWETTINGSTALELTVKGPQDAELRHAFADPLGLVVFQSDAERRLLNTGYDVAPVTERRRGGERRTKARSSKERRRP
jgi:hypothetical protein